MITFDPDDPTEWQPGWRWFRGEVLGIKLTGIDVELLEHEGALEVRRQGDQLEIRATNLPILLERARTWAAIRALGGNPHEDGPIREERAPEQLELNGSEWLAKIVARGGRR